MIRYSEWGVGSEDFTCDFPRDVALGYQCDKCADRDEGGYMGGDY